MKLTELRKKEQLTGEEYDLLDAIHTRLEQTCLADDEFVFVATPTECRLILKTIGGVRVRHMRIEDTPACGQPLGHLRLTRRPSKVNCGSCRRSKAFRTVVWTLANLTPDPPGHERGHDHCATVDGREA